MYRHQPAATPLPLVARGELTVGPAGTVVVIDDVAASAFAAGRADLVGAPVAELFAMHGRSAVDWQQRVADPDAPRPVGLEVYAVQADGRIAASAFRAVQDGAQPERGTVISVRTTDLPMSTELSRLRSELTARRKLGMPGTVTTLLLDSDLVVCRILAAGSDSALEPWRLVGRPVIRAVHPQDRSRARDAMVRAWSAPGTVVSVSVRTQSSMIPSVIDRVDLLLRAEPDDPYLHGLVCHVVASTARRAAGAGADVSVRDPLTGLSTWAGLRMEEDGDVAGAAVIIDIVGLDQLNEDLGYEAGDAVVLATAERLGTLVDPRRIARLGGGRFVIVGPYGGSPRRLQALARRVLRTTALPVGYLTHHIPVEVVIGTAAADTDGLNGLLQRAGLSLNMFRLSMDDEPQAYGPELTTETLTRARLVLGLRDIDYDAELSVAYQPIIELATGRQVGREALLRWTHPQLGPIGPDVFIPLAESMGTIGALGSWELHRACRDAAAWADDGAKALSLSINVSPRQLSWIGFADEVQAALAGSGLGAHRLVLEVTETAVLDQSDSSIRNLDQLARMGIRISLDDFGTGFSSLSLLHRLPIHELKIDRSFVAGLGVLDHSTAIVATVIDLARALGVTVVAEGIETPVQLQQLIALGCELGQGYLLGRPSLG